MRQQRVIWAASELFVREACDVHEVIAWAEEEARQRGAMYTLSAVIVTGGREGFVWIAGVEPTHGPPNFDQKHPLDVDPVNGSPEEVYGPGAGPMFVGG